MENEIMVSINCITYNQENFITDAIESFLMQKTNFRYEILLHDDASEDGTPEIIKKYAAAYPEMIKPIFQIENQYSKGIHVSMKNMERAVGKYIAYCEGDDFWTDPYKLQMQVDYMESHPDCTLCTHAVEKRNAQTNKSVGVIRPFNQNTKCLADEMIKGGGGFVGTNSLFFPRALLDTLPEWLLRTLIGDYAMQIYVTSQGYMYYFDRIMSVYRVNVIGSWTLNTCSSQEKAIAYWGRVIAMLNDIDQATDGKYSKSIMHSIRNYKFKIKAIENDYPALKGDEFRDIFNGLGRIARMKIFMKQYMPRTARTMIAIKRKLRI